MAKNMTHGQVQDLLTKFAAENTANRDALISNPKAVIEQLGGSLGDREVKAVVETADTIYVVVPYVSGDRELTEAELAEMSGGTGDFGGGDVQDGGTWS